MGISLLAVVYHQNTEKLVSLFLAEIINPGWVRKELGDILIGKYRIKLIAKISTAKSNLAIGLAVIDLVDQSGIQKNRD